MTEATTTLTVNPTCHACEGTGTDLMMGTRCTECERTGTARIIDPAERVGARHLPTGGNGTGHGTPTVTAPSEAQIRFITTLLAEADRTDARHAAECETVEMLIAEGHLTRKAASPVIDMLKAMPKAVTAARPATGRTNRFADRCAECGTDVPAEAGLLTKENNRWVTRHQTGGCTAPINSEVPEGHYAVVSNGDNDLMFVRVDRPERGGVFVKLIVGGHPDTNVRRDAVQGILDRIAEAGVDTAGRLYAAEIGRCYRCNKTLTDDASRAAGLGPTCRTMV